MRSPALAFSLVELSIVLVILGLLAGGILSGHSLIRAAELRATIAQTQRYLAAVHSFRDKYFALPGDMANATSFWGQEAAPPGCWTDSSITAATCNGNGDGMIDTLDSGTTYSEYFRFWQHLANAGLIEGQFSGVTGGGSARNAVLNVNIPAGKYPNTGFTPRWTNATSGSASYFDGPNGNGWWIGSTSASSYTYQRGFRTEDVWNTDTKLDDGKPGYGMVRTWKNGATYTPNCVTNDTATAEYSLTYTDIACAMLIFFK